VGKYCYERGLARRESITVETKAGIRTLFLRLSGDEVRAVTVNMGEPVLEPALIPCRFDGSRAVERPLLIDGKRWPVTCISMGNPHAVVFAEDIAALDLPLLGPKFEHHELFPARVNTGFAQVTGGRFSLRVWERGAGETLACGTGACAALVAAVLTGRSGREAPVHLPGGKLAIHWNEADNCVYMTGGADFVFDGEISTKV
jgi:diaminopimelate epimerase